MAVTVDAYKVNASSDKALHQPAHTSLWSFLRGQPRSGGKGAKMAMVELDWTGTDTYATGGFACDLLGNLPGWTEIYFAIGLPTYNSTATAAWEYPIAVDPNNGTAGSRMVAMFSLGTGAEVANARALAQAGCELLVIGY